MQAEEEGEGAEKADAQEVAEPADVSMFDEYDEELQAAIRMSMAEVQPGEEANDASKVSFLLPLIHLS